MNHVEPLKAKIHTLDQLQLETLKLIRRLRSQLQRQGYEEGTTDDEFLEQFVSPLENKIRADRAMAKQLKSLEGLKEISNEIVKCTDLYNWYWGSYGEKCYAFAVVACVAVDENLDASDLPENGSQIEWNSGNAFGTNTKGERVELYEMQQIAQIEHQQGGVICRFIAESYAFHVKEFQKQTEESR